MGTLDWTVFAAYLAFILWLGARASRVGRQAGGSRSDEFLLAGRSMPWWAVGLSVMATQASAITVIGTTGQAFRHGMGFVQFYFGLPLAMLILAFTLLPLYYRERVVTAYEYLGRRFDGRTRLATALLFLTSRGLALGVVIYAPSVVLSLLLGWDGNATVALVTAVALAYTVVGGMRAVIWTDVLQMLLIFGGLGVCALAMWERLPEGTDLPGVLALAEQGGRLGVLDWSLDPANRYTVWSGLLGGTFLFLAYFGCDQSQVQRLLACRSLSDGRRALAFNAVAKVPVQLAVLGLGVLLFVTLQFEDRQPILFDARVAAAVAKAGLGAQWHELEQRHARALADRRRQALAVAVPMRSGQTPDGHDGGARLLSHEGEGPAAWTAAEARVQALREEARELAARAGLPDADDTNHVFPWFVIRRLPVGLVGLLVAAIFAAAMSSIDSELNALAATTTIDLYRHHLRPDADEARLVRVARLATLGWGLLAALFALQAAALGSVIEAVNQVGSLFYGSLLGVFVLALGFPRATGTGAFWGLLAGMGAVAAASASGLAWLWLNPIGCLAAVGTGLALSRLSGRRGTPAIPR